MGRHPAKKDAPRAMGRKNGKCPYSVQSLGEDASCGRGRCGNMPQQITADDWLIYSKNQYFEAISSTQN
jgi:hypothetical protein